MTKLAYGDNIKLSSILEEDHVTVVELRYSVDEVEDHDPCVEYPIKCVGFYRITCLDDRLLEGDDITALHPVYFNALWHFEDGSWACINDEIPGIEERSDLIVCRVVKEGA